MPLKLKDLAKICESTESIITCLINLNLLLNLKDCICKFCEIGRFGFRKDSSLAGIITFGDVQTRNLIKKFLFKKDRGSRITI